MNITEASAVTVLLDAILAHPNDSQLRQRSRAEVRKAAVELAARAHKALMAGWTPEQAMVAGFREHDGGEA